jgi:hypothetical protein
MPSPKLTSEIITAAIEGFESQKRRIDGQIAELRSLLPGAPAKFAGTPEVPTRKRRKFSAAARRRMKEAQQLRWAKIRGESEPPAPSATTEPSKPKRKLSKAGRAAIVAALKKRWAAKKAVTAKPKPVIAKKAAVKKAAVKTAPAKAAKRNATVKKSAVKKSAPKKTAPAPTQASTETGAQ